MDHNHHRHRRRPSSDRFLSTFSPPTSTTTITSTSDDFSEDDIFSTTTNHPQPPPQPPQQPPLLRHNNSFSNQPSGILAALHNSPSRTISIIPQRRKSPLSLSPKYPQSAPMHVPFLPTFRQRGDDVDTVNEDEDDDEDGEMLPPHELVAKRLAETPVLSTSVLEGAGRTLKGRDLRQVRNAVFRHTGFID